MHVLSAKLLCGCIMCKDTQTVMCVTKEQLFCVTDDYEDDDEDEGTTAAAKGAPAGAKSTVSKLAEQATDAAGVSHG